MKAPRTVFLFCLLCAAMTLGAQQKDFPLHVIDDTGAAVTLGARPVRIVSLTLATDEILLGMVEPRRLQGVTLFASDPAISNVADLAAHDVPHKLEMNVETILSLDPDLVLVASWSDAAPVRQLGTPRAGVPHGERPHDRLYRAEDHPARSSHRRREQGPGDDRGNGGTALRRGPPCVAAAPEKRLRVIDYAAGGFAQGRGSSWDEMLVPGRARGRRWWTCRG